jgi:hypothetical protein
MRFTVVDGEHTISFIAPGNILKALTAGCSSKPAPTTLVELLEAASKYDTGLEGYVQDGLAIFDEHYSSTSVPGVPLDPHLEEVLRAALQTPLPGNVEDPEESPPSVTFADLRLEQQSLSATKLAAHPVLRVQDDTTRNESLQPVGAGLVIFNLRAKRIVQVQNSYGVLHRSDRGRYFENGQPTERLFFYRLPSDWSMVP